MNSLPGIGEDCAGQHSTPVEATHWIHREGEPKTPACLAHYTQARRHPGSPLRPLRSDTPPRVKQVNVSVTYAEYEGLAALAHGGGHAGVTALLRAAIEALLKPEGAA
jgi:hypothetical protein